MLKYILLLLYDYKYINDIYIYKNNYNIIIDYYYDNDQLMQFNELLMKKRKEFSIIRRYKFNSKFRRNNLYMESEL